jgi:hypothetical protein
MPSLPPCINLAGDQYVCLDNKFIHTGPTTKPSTICSYILNDDGTKMVPHVDISGRMMKIPNNVPSMLEKFQQVIHDCNDPKPLVAIRNARLTLALISQMK